MLKIKPTQRFLFGLKPKYLLVGCDMELVHNSLKILKTFTR